MSVYVWHDGSERLSPMLSKLTVRHGSSIEQLVGIKSIIRFSGDDRKLDDKCPTILNHSSYTKQLQNDKEIRAILQLNSILYRPPQYTTTQLIYNQNESHYLIPVFLMDALAIYRMEAKQSNALKRPDKLTYKLHEITNETKTSVLRRLERYAIRAVYALGLDFACVYAYVPRTGVAVISHLDVNPLYPIVYERYAMAINDYEDYKMTEELRRKSVVFGMDPEFLLRNTHGKIVPASRYVQEKGYVGYDSATVLGRKHIHPLVELRPEPSNDLRVLVNNLRRTMWLAASQITDPTLEWIAGGMPIRGLPLGGHLHITGIWPDSSLIRALDNYLALPLVMMEDTSTSGRRKKYGRLGDVRRPSHGGFEYRTLPSWLVSPRLTKGVLALTRLIIQHVELLNARPLDRTDILIAYQEGNKRILEPIVANLWHQVEATSAYNEYHMYLEPLKEWIMSQRIWNEQLDIRAAWRIPPFQ